MISLSQTSWYPGDIIKISHPLFTHYGIISDQIGGDGMPMVIDNSFARGRIQERSWSEAVRGKKTTLSKLSCPGSGAEIVACARSFIGPVRYSLTRYNCESFVREVLGLQETSRQVATSAVTVPGAMATTFRLTKGNIWLTLIVGIATLAVTNRVVSD